MLYTGARLAGRTNAYVSSAFQRATHLSSRPSSAGFSGTPAAIVVGASVRGSAKMATILILEKSATADMRVSCCGRLRWRSHEGVSRFQLGKIAEVTISCPQLGNSLANAYSSDSGVMNLGADNCGTQAEAIKDVEMALRLPEQSGVRLCTKFTGHADRRLGGRRCLEDPGVRDDGQEFMHTGPRHGPTPAVRNQSLYGLQSRSVLRQVAAVGVDQNVGIYGDHREGSEVNEPLSFAISSQEAGVTPSTSPSPSTTVNSNGGGAFSSEL